MARCYAQGHANPASQHRPGQSARGVLETAREQIAEILGVDLAAPRRDRLIFTSGGTEANNLAILGMAAAGGGQPGRIIISLGEHPSVIEPRRELLEQGWRLDTLGLGPDGVVRVEQLPPLLASPTEQPASAPASTRLTRRPETAALGGPTGGPTAPPGQRLAGQPRDGRAAADRGDGGDVPARPGGSFIPTPCKWQASCRVSFRRVGRIGMTVAAHKFRGPPGIGALIVERGRLPV